jgi:hypothetical protein
MDCKIARLLLEMAGSRQSELDAPEAEALEDHLGDCPECRSRAETERRLDEQLGRAVRAVPVPPALQDRLLARLEADRSAWYRRQTLRIAALLTAAASILAGFLLWFQRETPRANVELETACHAVYQQTGSPPERVNEWFQETYGLQTVAPTGFNYSHLKFYDLADFQGKRVPLLLFIRGEHNARVYILSAAEFNVDEVAAAPGYNVKFWHNPTDRRFAYVAVYSSERLDWFLEKDAEIQLGLNETAAGVVAY